MNDDAQLLIAWRAGDQAAGSALFNRYFELVRRFFSGKVSEGVEDLVQQTFLACVAGRERIREDLGFRPYLFATARSKLYDQLRKVGRAPSFDKDHHSLAELGVTPSSAIAGREEEQIVLQALRQLPVELQLALELYYFEQMRGPELAVALEVPEGTIRSRLRRALELLRKEIDVLVRSPELRRETSARLDAWAERVRAEWADSNGGE